MKDFRQLKVWEKAHALTLATYRATATFPKEELYGLTSQVRRASLSIAANIAEGCGRKSQAEFAHFLQISMGSASELEYEFLLAHDLNFIQDAIYERLHTDTTEIKRMLASLIKVLRVAR